MLKKSLFIISGIVGLTSSPSYASIVLDQKESEIKHTSYLEGMIKERAHDCYFQGDYPEELLLKEQLYYMDSSLENAENLAACYFSHGHYDQAWSLYMGLANRYTRGSDSYKQYEMLATRTWEIDRQTRMAEVRQQSLLAYQKKHPFKSFLRRWFPQIH